MIALLQRVLESKVVVEGQTLGQIDQGLTVLVGVQKGDTQAKADKLLDRLLHYRVFADENDKMNLDLQQVQGDLLLIPQFTLAANTHKGRRPSFDSSAPPGEAEALFNYFVAQAKARYALVETGQFGADMKVHILNDGPVTFWLET